MTAQKSPCGAYFPYYFKGGELFGWHLGSFFADEEAVIARMKSEELFFTQQNRRIGVWLDLYQTRLTPRVISELVALLTRVHGLITKLGLVGCSWRDKRSIGNLIKKTPGLSSLPVRFFDDPEDAKSWLVGELH